jgi:hypothetical protein
MKWTEALKMAAEQHGSFNLKDRDFVTLAQSIYKNGEGDEQIKKRKRRGKKSVKRMKRSRRR